MDYAQWYDPCPRSPPHHVWYPKREGEATLVVILNNRCCYCYNRRWGPQRKSSQRSGGWKTCQCSSTSCNCSRFSFFSCFSCQLCYFVGAACQCLSMLGTSVFMNWFIIWGLSWAPFEELGGLDWTKINVAKSKFSMLKSIEMRHPEYPSCKVQLHPAEEQDLEVTFTLEENEEFVGFQFFEAKQSAQKTHEVKMNSSLFKEVSNKSARVGAVASTTPSPVRSRMWTPEPASGTIQTFWSALRRRHIWNHCQDISSTRRLRSLGDVVGSLPRPSLPLMAQSKETRHRLKLVRKDSVVFESRRLECLLKFIKKSIFPRESLRMKGKPNWSSWLSWPSKIPKKSPSFDTNAVPIRRNRQIIQKERRLVLSC